MRQAGGIRRVLSDDDRDPCQRLRIRVSRRRPTGSDHCSRAATERAIAHLKTWLLSKEGGWFRPLLSKFETALKAIIGLFFFSNYCEIFE
jgi:hypothetical protein